MKKLLSLFLVFLICIFSCACSKTTSDISSDVSSKPDENFEDILYNNGLFWVYTNHLSNFAFNKDGTTITPDGKWTLSGNIVNCTFDKGGSETYEIKELGGVYYLVGTGDVLYSDEQININDIPRKTVELTLDNWQEYLEIGTETNSLGEPLTHFIKLKDEYYRILIEDESEFKICYSLNSNETNLEIKDAFYDSKLDEYYFGMNDFEIGENDLFEMIDVQGILYLIDGI